MCHRYQVTLPLVDKGRGGEGQLERWCLVSNYRYVAKLLLRHSNWWHSQCEQVFLDLQLVYYMCRCMCMVHLFVYLLRLEII